MEDRVFYITGSASGFFVNQSTDSDLLPAGSSEFPAVYTTLCHLLKAVSPQFAAWYDQRVKKGDSTDGITLEELLGSFHPLPSCNAAAQRWFRTAPAGDANNLLEYADQILEASDLPWFSSDVSTYRDWLSEYTLAKSDELEEMTRLFYAVERENEFAQAAVRGAMRIVDGECDAEKSCRSAAPAQYGDTEANVSDGQHHFHAGSDDAGEQRDTRHDQL